PPGRLPGRDGPPGRGGHRRPGRRPHRPHAGTHRRGVHPHRGRRQPQGAQGLSAELGLDEHVHFTGRAPDEEVFRILSTADVGLSPDPKNPLNDVSTMNKTMEYMAFGVPVVAFDLKETRVSAQDAAVYAEPNEVAGYAQAIVDLLDDGATRRRMG